MKEFDPINSVGPVPSPCISVCVIHDKTKLCEGCFRTLDEIAIWGSATEQTKRAICIEISLRRK